MSYYITKTTVKAPIAHITDGADEVPLKSWDVEIAPTLTGKSAVVCTQTGKTVFYPMDIEQGSISGSGYNSDSIYRIRTAERKAVTPSTQYKIKVNSEVQIYEVHEYTDLTGSSTHLTVNASEYTFTTKSTTNYLKILFRYSNNTTITPSAITELQVTDGDLYWKTYTASLGRTIYGGTADVVNGTGKDNRLKYELDETDSWGAYSGTTHSFWHNVATGEDRPIKQTEVTTSICNELAYSSNTPATAPDFSFCIQGGQRIVVTADSTIDTVDKFKTWLSSHNLVFVCPATTPTDFTFTPITPTPETALGVNNFWADTGDSEVTYYFKVESTEKYTIEDSTLRDIADAIRTKTEKTDPIFVEDMSEEILSITSGGGGDFQCDRLFYAKGYDNWQVEIPTIASLITGEKYSEYVSYDTTTKKFTALKDFTAVIVAWVYTYQTYEASRSDGAFYVNSTKLAQYEANGNAAGSVGGVRLIYNLKQGDTFYPYTPTTDGYPRQYCKVYAISDIDDDVFTYANEEAT